MQDKNVKKGKFIVFEGIDASGKDTQQDLFQKYLAEKSQDFIFVKHLSENKKHTLNLRNAMFNSDFKWNTISEMMLFWADKFELKMEIQKYLNQGKNVIVNRWELSNMAYQIYGKERFDLEDFARNTLAKLDENLKPDLYIYFDISAEESIKRREKRLGEDYKRDDYYEKEKKDFFDKVIAGYKIEMQKYNHKIINANRSREIIFDEVLDTITNQQHMPALFSK